MDPETRKSLRMDYDQIAAQKWALQWERQHGQQRDTNKQLHAMIDAVEARDAGAVLENLTRNKSTFQAWEMNRAFK